MLPLPVAFQRTCRLRRQRWRSHGPLVAAAMIAASGCAAVDQAPRRVNAVPLLRQRHLETSPGAAGKPSARGDAPRSLPVEATLDDYRLFAAENNPKLRALYHEWRAMSERSAQARSLPEPRVTYSEYLRSVETRTGPQERSVGVMQPLPWLGKLRLRGRVAEAAARAAWERFFAAQLELDHKVRTTFADYYFLERSIAITRSNLELLSELEAVARRRVAAGTGDHHDVARLQAEIGRLSDRIETDQDLRRPLVAKLNALLGRQRELEVAPPKTLPEPPALPDDETVRRLVREHNPELLALHEEVERAALGKKLARQEYFPDVAVGFQTILTENARVPNTRDSGQDPWLLTFAVELPVWIGKYRAQEREAAAQWQAASERKRDAESELIAEVELSLHHLRDAERRITLYGRSLVPIAREALKSTESGFQAGTDDFLELIDAEGVLLDFRLAGERAHADRLRASAALDRLLGRFELAGSPRQQETSS